MQVSYFHHYRNDEHTYGGVMSFSTVYGYTVIMIINFLYKEKSSLYAAFKDDY